MDKQEEFFAEHLRRRARSYYPSLESERITVTLHSVSHRPSASLYRYIIADKSQSHRVLVKMRHGRQDPKYASANPRRYVVNEAETFWLEHRALSSIHQLFLAEDGEHFGAIRVLDVFDDLQAIIMTHSDSLCLRDIFARQNRLQGFAKNSNLTPVFANAGAWLKRFHALPAEADTELCHYTRGEFIDCIERICDHLAQRTGKAAYFRKLGSGIAQYAADMLATEMPLGRTHGDFAMRNILVEEPRRVVVIDTIAKWQTAIYEDIGYFAARLWTNQLQVYSLGMAYNRNWLESVERAFLQAYFKEAAVPHQVIGLYKILSLLDQWSASTEILGQKQNLKNRLRMQLTGLYFPVLVDNWMARLPHQ